MTFFEHLEELRRRLVYIAIAVLICSVIAWFFAYDQVLRLLEAPLEGQKLGFRTVTEPFVTKIIIALSVGIAAASPFILYQLLSFLSPALTGRERRVLYPVLFFGSLLFASGIFMGYEIIMPVGVRWLLGQGEDLVNLMTIGEYIGFVTRFLLAIGLAFEAPIFLLLLVAIGIVTPEGLQKGWRTAILVTLVSAAILTPDQSPVTMALLAGPMLVLYVITVIVAKILMRRRERRELVQVPQ